MYESEFDSFFLEKLKNWRESTQNLNFFLFFNFKRENYS